MDTLQFHIVGTSPLIVHNARLANPLDYYSKKIKELTGIKGKTEDIILAIMRLEWEGGMYFDQKVGPYIPGENIEATLKNAAKLQKRGKDVMRGLVVMERCVPIKYKGPRTLDEMYAHDNQHFVDVRSAKVGRSRVMRTRPIFPEWSLAFTVQFDSEVFNAADVAAFVRDGGKSIGLCEMRPRYGSFEANGKS